MDSGSSHTIAQNLDDLLGKFRSSRFRSRHWVNQLKLLTEAMSDGKLKMTMVEFMSFTSQLCIAKRHLTIYCHHNIWLNTEMTMMELVLISMGAGSNSTETTNNLSKHALWIKLPTLDCSKPALDLQSLANFVNIATFILFPHS